MVEHIPTHAKRAVNRQSPGGVFVQAPSARDGISSALRRSFSSKNDALPDDMLALLARLDRA